MKSYFRIEEHVVLLAVSGGARFCLGRIVCGIGECGDGGVALAAGRRWQGVGSGLPDARRGLACYRWGVTPDREDSTPSDRVECSR